jgi:hypothetical protein
VANNIYTNKEYLGNNPTWHQEDSPWKAEQIYELLQRNRIKVDTVAEIGCGAGGVLVSLAEKLPKQTALHGFDISPQAIAIAKRFEKEGLSFSCEDLLKRDEQFDLLLVVDVVEHVRDYLGFMESCRLKAHLKVFHIPLDIHVSSVIRAHFVLGRHTIGHLHYFSAESALDTVRDTGHKVIDFRFTDGGVALASFHPSFRRSIANIPRRVVGFFSRKLAARWFGGYSLLVLAE